MGLHQVDLLGVVSEACFKLETSKSAMLAAGAPEGPQLEVRQEVRVPPFLSVYRNPGMCVHLTFQAS